MAVLEQLRCHSEPLAITLEQTENDRLLEEKKSLLPELTVSSKETLTIAESLSVTKLKK